MSNDLFDGNRIQDFTDGATAFTETWFNSIQDHLADFIFGYSDVSLGVAARSAPERFVVHAPVGGQRELAGQSYSQQGPAGAYAVKTLCGDGEQLYVAQDIGSQDVIYNLDPTDGQPPASGNWNTALGASSSAIAQMFADGQYLWVACIHNVPGLYRVDVSDGSYTKYTGHGAINLSLVAGNGYYVACVDTTNTSYVHVYDLNGTYQGYYDAGLAGLHKVRAICCIDDICLVVASHDTAHELVIHSFKLSTQAAIGNTGTLAASPDVVDASIACDGRRIYIGHTQSTWDATQRSVTCFSFAWDKLWSYDAGGDSANAIWAGVDSLYVSDDTTDDVDFLDKTNGKRLMTIADSPPNCGDGISLFSAFGNNIYRHWLCRTFMEFMRASAAQSTRKPWPGMLCQPTGRQL